MKYNKLVRDKIPEIIKNNREIPITHIASNDEYWTKLKEKLKEEVDEFLETDNEEELVDVLEVIDEIYDFRKINKNKLEKLKKEKREVKGGFDNKIILDEVKD